MAIFGLWKDPKTYFWGARISISGSTYLSFGKHGEKYPDFEVDCDLLYGPENTSDHYEVFKALPHTENVRQQIDAPGLVEHAKRLSLFLDKIWATPISIAVWVSCPQACITPTS